MVSCIGHVDHVCFRIISWHLTVLSFHLTVRLTRPFFDQFRTISDQKSLTVNTEFNSVLFTSGRFQIFLFNVVHPFHFSDQLSDIKDADSYAKSTINENREHLCRMKFQTPIFWPWNKRSYSNELVEKSSLLNANQN